MSQKLLNGLVVITTRMSQQMFHCRQFAFGVRVYGAEGQNLATAPSTPERYVPDSNNSVAKRVCNTAARDYIASVRPQVSTPQSQKDDHPAAGG